MKFTEQAPLLQAMEHLFRVVAPDLGRLGEEKVIAELFHKDIEKDDPLDYIRRAYELHYHPDSTVGEVNFYEILGMAFMVVRGEPEDNGENYRRRIIEATGKLERIRRREND